MPDLSKPISVLVNASNHEWAAEMTGYTVKEVASAYRFACQNDVVCTIESKIKRGYDV